MRIVTNAVQASARLNIRAVPVLRLWLVSDEQSIVIRVWDGSDDMPERRDAEADADGGRGLMLVEALGKEWGAYRKAHGKVVWVLIGADS